MEDSTSSQTSVLSFTSSRDVQKVVSVANTSFITLLASSSDPGATGNFSAVALVIQWDLTGFQWIFTEFSSGTWVTGNQWPFTGSC